jgi:hypothetical protein
MTTRNAEAVSRALRNIREFGETHSHPVSKPTPSAVTAPRETTSQEGPGEAASESVGLDHAE